jgi:uncharacterized protein YbjT (DUF2867 family)
MSGKTLVVGANGTVGSRVAAALAAAGMAYVCGLRRKDASGRPSVLLDFQRPETFSAALSGVDRVFLIAPGFTEDADALLASFLAAVAKAGVRHVLYSSVIGAEYNPTGVHRRVELALEASGIPWTFFRPNFYLQNFITYEADAVLGRGEIALPTGDGAASYLDVGDLAEAAARVLAAPQAHAGRSYTLTGPAPVSHGAIAASLTQTLGFPVLFTNPAPEARAATLAAAGVPADVIAQSEGLYALIRGNVCAGVSPDLEQLLGRRGTDVDAWAAREAVAALRARSGAAEPTASTLVSRVNALMTAWEYGNTEAYAALCAPGVRMTIPEYGLDVRGFDALWGVRVGLRALEAGPLHIHTVDTHVVDGRSVSGQAHVIHRSEGRFTQHGVVRFDFDAGARLTHYHQVNTWMG